MERASPRRDASGRRNVAPGALTVALLAVLLAFGGGDTAGAAMGIDDNCPAPPSEMNVIISDEPTIRGTPASDYICGGRSANVIVGGLLDDEIHGGGGDDTIIGGHGTDLLDGGSGDDWLRGGDGQDCNVGGYRSETSTDTVSFATATPEGSLTGSGISANLWRGDTTVSGVPPGCAIFNDGRAMPGPGMALGEGWNEELVDIDNIVGSAFGDAIWAEWTPAGTVTQINGGGGDDYLYGGGGDDRLWGEDGSDTCMNDVVTTPCADGQGAHRPAGAYAFVENRGRDYGLVVLGAEGVANESLEVTRPAAEKLRVTAASSLGAGSGCTVLSERVVDCPLAAARYVVVYGSSGDDALSTAGNLSPTPGTISVNGGPGDDAVTGSGSEELLYGSPGVDTVNGNGGSDALISLEDETRTGGGGDVLNGGDGDDQLVTNNACAGHTFQGGLGRDIVGFARQARVKRGVPGSETGVLAGVRARLGDGSTNYTAVAIDASGTTLEGCRASTMVPGTEVLEGTNQADDLTGNGQRNTLWARRGDDLVKGLGEDDVIKGQDGRDSAFGGGGDDNITGGDGEDQLTGESGLDSLFGQASADTLFARDGQQDTAVNCGDGSDIASERDAADPVIDCER